MEIRVYQSSDGKALAELFYHTVHTVNARDYTKEQLDAWATGTVDLEKWNQSFEEHDSLVAVDNEMIVGFGDMDKTGYLDRLFVHSDYQRKGIATAICDRLEQAIQGKIVTHSSITARPFFEKRGYKVVHEQQVERQGIFLTNFIMEKEESSHREKVITIFDWWDGPLCGLATYQEMICIYERIFDEDEDDWSDEYYLTPIDVNAVNVLLKDWAVWCETIRNKKLPDITFRNRSIYHDIIESSAQKRVYKKTAVFCGAFNKGFIPVDYGVEWTDTVSQ